MKIDEYYSRLMGFYDELSRLKPLLSCDCKKCKCGLALKLSKERDEEIFYKFLIGLDDTKYMMCAQISFPNSPWETLTGHIKPCFKRSSRV